MVTALRTLLALLAIIPALAQAAFVASVDRQVIDENDVVVLELRRDAQVFVGSPDLAALDDDFNVLGTQRASQFTIIGGRTRSVTTWSVTLQPKRRGTLVIPSIEYDGERSEPITITVTQPTPQELAALQRTVFFETELDDDASWVQEQLRYTVRLYYAADAVLFGDLPPAPSLENAVVQALGDSRPGVEVRDGQRYNVIEQRYAVVPQRSGTLIVPPETFVGAVRIAERGRARRKNIRVASEGHRIDVRPQPANWPATEPWLPASDLRLTERYEPSPPTFRAGEPVTRTLELVARGVAASTLPELSAPIASNARSYPNQPTLDEGVAGDAFIATRIESTVIVPDERGTLDLPELRVHWFDVDDERIRIASVPARRYAVGAGSAAGAALPSAPAAVEAQAPVAAPTDATPRPEEATATDPAPARTPLWIIVVALAALLWLATVVIWLRRREQRPGPGRRVTAQAVDPLAAVRTACQGGDARAARQALTELRFSGELDPQASRDLSAATLELDQRLFGSAPDAGPWQAAALLAVLDELETRRRRGPPPTPALPALYPNDSRVSPPGTC